MPGNIEPPSRSRDIRFSRSSSFTRRELRRCAVKAPWRNSPSVRAELMVGNLRRKQPNADYTAASVAVLSDEASERKDTLPGMELCGQVRDNQVEERRRRVLTTEVHRGNLPHFVG